MIEHPDQLIPEFAKAGQILLLFMKPQASSQNHSVDPQSGVAGVALNPATPCQYLIMY
ncbi:MAG: hypothetical protein ACLR5Q_04845 [Coprococcus sp.]